MEKKWIHNSNGITLNYVLEGADGVFISYNPCPNGFLGSDNGSAETAIVLEKTKADGRNSYLILNGDFREELEELYPDVDKMVRFFESLPAQHSSWSDSAPIRKENN